MLKGRTHNVYIFNKTNYGRNVPEENQIQIGKKYMLFDKVHTSEKLNFGDTSGDIKEISYFYAIDEQGKVVTNKKYEALTNWWHTEVSFKNAKLIGEIESAISFSEIKPTL